MADKSSIEWTDATWNIVTGCSRVSAGCQHCWAEREAAGRLKNQPSRQGLTDHIGRWNGKINFNGQWLARPLRWARPRRIFVASSGDLFHPNIPDSWIDQVFAVMAETPWHAYQVLTKRPERMRAYLLGGAAGRIARIIEDWLGGEPVADDYWLPRHRERFYARLAAKRPPLFSWPLPNVWLGVSAEDQATADSRIPVLLETPAAVRWLSAEPLLGPMEIDDFLWPVRGGRPALDWVVAGGESGPGARPMDPSWPRSLRSQCICAQVPYFFKQWGGATSKAGGCELDGRTWQQMPERA